ncbi:MAG: hypothetical protein Q8L57_04120 [bacterium]|nr:hypothetical protein [bacterium]
MTTAINEEQILKVAGIPDNGILKTHAALKSESGFSFAFATKI